MGALWDQDEYPRSGLFSGASRTPDGFATSNANRCWDEEVYPRIWPAWRRWPRSFPLVTGQVIYVDGGYLAAREA